MPKLKYFNEQTGNWEYISTNGAPGKSAYQYAQEAGYTGTEEEFATKLASEEVVQSDWNVAEGQPGHVLNRTHWEAEEVSNKPLSLTWDGNTTGLTSVMGALYKISDLVFTDDEIKLMTVTLNVGDSFELGTAWDMLLKSDDAVGNDVIIFVRKDGAVLNDTVFAEKGIYVFSMDGAYVSSITTTEPIELVTKVVHKLPEKFLPDSVALKTDISTSFCVTVTGSNGSYTADKTFAEISAAYQDNKNIYCKLSCAESDFDTGDGHMVVPLININDTDVCFTTIQYDMSIFICIADSGETTFEYMFIPENNYTHPATHPASMITGLATVATSGKYSDLSGRPTIPTVPTALKNPNALTINGTAYDGSETKEVFIPHVSNIQNTELDGETCVEITFEQSEDVTKIQYIPYAPSALPNPTALTINGEVYDGSKAVTIDTSTLYVSITLEPGGIATMSHTVADIEEAYQNNRTIVCNYASATTLFNHLLPLIRRKSSTEWIFGSHLVSDEDYIRVNVNGTNVAETVISTAAKSDIPTDDHINELISAQLSAITNAEEVAF